MNVQQNSCVRQVLKVKDVWQVPKLSPRIRLPIKFSYGRLQEFLQKMGNLHRLGMIGWTTRARRVLPKSINNALKQ